MPFSEFPEPPKHVDPRDSGKKNSNASKGHSTTKLDRLHIGLAVAGVVLGLPPFIYYIGVFTAGKEKQPDWPVGLAFLCLIGILILVLALFAARFYALYRIWRRQYESLESRFSRTLATFAKLFHNLPHLKRDLLTSKDLPVRDIAPMPTVETLISYCDDIKVGLEYLFHSAGLKFNVAIKAIAEVNQDRTQFEAFAIARNRQMIQADSYKVDNSRPHSVLQNTAFKSLLEVKPPVFACDDLRKLQTYQNTSPDWFERYDATIVIPIRKNAVAGKDSFELVGYIGVDTFTNGNGRSVFCHLNGNPREDIVDFLLGYGDSIYAILTRARVVGDQGIFAPFNSKRSAQCHSAMIAFRRL